MSTDGDGVFSNTTFSFSNVSVVSVTHAGIGFSGAMLGGMWGLVQPQNPSPGIFDFIQSVGALPVYAGTHLVNGVQTRAFTLTPTNFGAMNNTVFTVYDDSATHHPVRITISNPTASMTIMDFSNFTARTSFPANFFKWLGPLPEDTGAYNASIVPPNLSNDLSAMYPQPTRRAISSPVPSANQSTGRHLLTTCTISGSGASSGCTVGWKCSPTAGTTGTCVPSGRRKLMLGGYFTYSGSWNVGCADVDCWVASRVDVTGVTLTTMSDWIGRPVTVNASAYTEMSIPQLGVYGDQGFYSLTQPTQKLNIVTYFFFYPYGYTSHWDPARNLSPGSVSWMIKYNYWYKVAGSIPIMAAFENADILNPESVANNFRPESAMNIPVTSCVPYTASNGGVTTAFISASVAVGAVIKLGTTNLVDQYDMYRMGNPAVCTGDTFLTLMSGTTVLATFDDFGSSLCSYGTYTFTAAVPYGSLSIKQGCYGSLSCTGTTVYTISYLPSTLTLTTATPSFAGAARSLQTYTIAATVLPGSVIAFGTTNLVGSKCTGATYLSLLSAGSSVAAVSNYGSSSCSYGSYTATAATAYNSFTIQAGCYSSASCSGTVVYTITPPGISG